MIYGKIEKTWEEETLELIQEFESEKKKAIQRVESAKRSVEAIEQKLIGLKAALDAYRHKYGLPQSPVEPDLDLAAEFDSMSPEEMIEHRATTADGFVAMNALVKDIFATGMYADINQARSALYHAIARMPNFTKERPGYYRRNKEPSENDQFGAENLQRAG